MTNLVYIAAGVFLPLFPLSMLFNLVYTHVRNPFLRSVLLLAWPQLGLAMIITVGHAVPHWFGIWALLTSLLYALRAVALREVGLWTSFVGTSAWALLWILLDNGAGTLQMKLYALGISIPLGLMALLSAGLERRFGAAYLGLYGGLAQSIPRFAGVLVVVVLAIVATPLFPTFFAMLSMIIHSLPIAPFVAVGLAVVWLLWSWAGAKLLQGLIVGPARVAAADLSQVSTWLYVAALTGLVIAGMYELGAMA